ncbi:MAG TPA: DinB family protein [Thermomicrobiaceae bacterium]|nr:DinB family protein [Thermomicrobiaceae bacterium]
MDLHEAIRAQIAQSRWLFDGITADVTEEQAHWTPPGNVIPIAAIWAHVLLGEDMMLTNIFNRGPEARLSFNGDFPISELIPEDSAEYVAWAHRVRINPDGMREYTKAIRDRTDAFIASLSDEDLSATMDSFMGEQPTASYIYVLLVQHVDEHGGEIACLKGIQGAKGLPY